MSEFMEGEGYVDKGVNTGTVQVDDFSRKLNDFLADDNFTNKENISNVLKSNSDLKNGFEEFLKIANSLLKMKCKKSLKSCNTEDEIKSVIAEVIPEGYRIGNTGSLEVGEIVDDEDILNNAADEAVQDNATAENKEATAENKEATAENKEATVDEANADKKNVINIEEMTLKKEEDLELRRKLLEGHDDVKAKTEEKAKLAQQQLPEGTRNQLKEKGYDDKFINDYILLRVTLNEVKGNSNFDKNQVAQFESSVNELSTLDVILKNLDNACNIPDTNLDSFSKENITKTRSELFNEDIGNQSLIEVRNHNKDNRDYSEVFHEMGEEELIKNYGNLLEGVSKDFLTKYQTNPKFKTLTDDARKVKGNSDATNQDKQLGTLYDNMITELKDKKMYVEEKTKDMIEEMCLITQVNGMAKCIGQENFSFNKAREIKIDEKDGSMILDGHIDGVNFSVSHNPNKESSRLQTSSKLVKIEDGNSFEIGKKGEPKFKDSPFILPGQKDIFNMITGIITSTSNPQNFSKVDDYIENMQNNITGNVEKLYKNSELAHHYMEGQVKGEKIVDSSLSYIQHIKPGIDLTQPISQVSGNKDIYSFMKILNFNIENSTDVEKNKLDKCITRIQEITDSYKNNNGVEDFVSLKYPPIIDNYLKDKVRLNGGNEDSRLGSLSGLFDYYSKKSKDTREGYENGFGSKVMINDLYKDLFESDNGNNPSQTANERNMEQKLNSYEQEAQKESESADPELDNILKNDKDFPPSPSPIAPRMK